MSKALIKTEKTVVEMLTSDRNKQRLETMLPRHLKPEMVMRSVLNCVRRVPKLLACTQDSFWAAIMDASTLGLLPDGTLGEGAIIPFKDEAKFIPMYQGLIKLMMQSELVTGVSAEAVYERDEFEIQQGTDPKIIHKPFVRGDRGKLIGAYAVAHLKSGTSVFKFLT